MKQILTKKTQMMKFFIGVTILLSLTVFLNLVAETLPQVSDAIPLLGREHTSNMIRYIMLLGIILCSTSPYFFIFISCSIG